MHKPPHIYLEIFLLGLVVQALFRVTLVTLSAAAALYVLNLWYTGMTGDYQFIDSNIPVAVFLGLHLLTTDPATSPRRDLGKIIFGGPVRRCGVWRVQRSEVNRRSGILRQAVDCSASQFDPSGCWIGSATLVAARFKSLTASLRSRPRTLNYAWMGVWICLFVIMTASGFLVKGNDHPGSNPAFWAHACQQGRSGSCATWTNMLGGRCQDGSAADCQALGKIFDGGKFAARDEARAAVTFGRACDLGLQEGCVSLITFMRKGGSETLAAACDRGDGASCFLLGSLFSGGAGVPKDPALAFQLFEKACGSGWWRACGRLGVSYLNGQGTPVNPGLAIASFEKGCQGQNAASCLEAAQFYRREKLGDKTEALTRRRLQQACELGLQTACQPEANAAMLPAPH